MNSTTKGSHLVGKTVCDFEHLGRVLAERHRRGALYIFDVRDRHRRVGAMTALLPFGPNPQAVSSLRAAIAIAKEK